MGKKLEGKKIAIVATDGFEQVELTSPKEALEQEGAIGAIISPKEGKIKGWKHVEWGEELEVDVALARAKVDDYDALVLPGGVMSPDKLRVLPEMRRLVKSFSSTRAPTGSTRRWWSTTASSPAGSRTTSRPSTRR